MDLHAPAAHIASMHVPGRPLFVAIDGGSAVGKTTFAARLRPLIEAHGRSLVAASIDDFHRPRAERYARGRLSPEGCYHDTFDYPKLRSALLEPLRDGRPFVTAAFDAVNDRPVHAEAQTAPRDAILLFEGVWLMRPELDAFWDYRILLTAPWDVIAERGIRRDMTWGGTYEEVANLYANRYIPADKLYFALVQPELKADIVTRQHTRPAAGSAGTAHTSEPCVRQI
jgi:uridine kinase